MSSVDKKIKANYLFIGRDQINHVKLQNNNKKIGIQQCWVDDQLSFFENKKSTEEFVTCIIKVNWAASFIFGHQDLFKKVGRGTTTRYFYLKCLLISKDFSFISLVQNLNFYYFFYILFDH